MKTPILLCDFFDTIVHRVIPPEDVKKIWARKLQDNFSLSTDLYNVRSNLEKLLCEKNIDLYSESEFVYNTMCEDIYRTMIADHINISSTEFVNYARELELTIEKQVQFLDNENVTFIKKKKLDGVKIFLVSDFYFDEALFRELLIYHGIAELFDTVYISCEYMASKRSGRIFEIIKKQYYLENYANVSIMGDNKFADVENPKKLGITALWANANHYHDYYINFKNASTISEYIKRFDKIYNTNDKLVYSEITLALFRFIQDLCSKLVTNNITQVLFMAREGEFLKKLFDNYVSFARLDIKSEYFYVSRRATFLPSLRGIDNEQFEILFRQYTNISAQEFLLNLNFSISQINSLEMQLLFDFNKRINDFHLSDEYSNLRKNKSFIEVYEQNRQEQLTNFKQYLFINGLVNCKKLVVVDVGWKGTIQDNLARILPDYEITGYYLGLNLYGSDYNNSIKIPILFDQITAWDISNPHSVYNECTSIFEIVLGASHGSVKSYNSNGTVDLLENKIELDLYESIISPLQSKMFEYFKLLIPLFSWSGCSESEVVNYINKRYASFIFAPTIEQISLYNDLYHVESFGIHETTVFSSNGRLLIRSLFEFIRNPKSYIKSAFWPAQKLKLNNLGFLIPFYKYFRLWKISR